MSPLVTVICLSYNHSRFIDEALGSMLSQSYDNIQIIIIDDASTDDSVEFIRKKIKGKSGVEFIINNTNLGNCSSFNKGLQLARGKYVVDFAMDDLMSIDRIEKQVQKFETLSEEFGVVFTDSFLINEEGKKIGTIYKVDELPPSGNVYAEVLKKSYIGPPTMMIRRSVLEYLGGYDESLSYEDFDFWVRSAREYKYCYIADRLTSKRITSQSLSSRFYLKQHPAMLESTLKVCKKALWLNQSIEENRALAARLKYEMRQAFYMENFELVNQYNDLLNCIGVQDRTSLLIYDLSRYKVRVYPYYSLYKKIFH